MRKIQTLALFAAMLLSAAAFQPAVAEEFNNQQKDEIGKIVREYLLNNPEIILEVTQELQKRREQQQASRSKAAISTNAPDIYRSPDDPIVGNPNGTVTMVEFFDYNCGYCKRSISALQKLVEEDKDLRFIAKEFPIFGEGSNFAAKAALAARQQGKYWELHSAMMQEPGQITEPKVLQIAADVGLDLEKLKADMNSSEVSQTLSRNEQLADALGINGTPAFIIDDELIPGAVGYDALRASIMKVREKGGCKVC